MSTSLSGKVAIVTGSSRGIGRAICKIAAGMSPFARIGEPAEVASVAAFLASDDARWVTGQNVGAGGGVF
jgi:NAD(P)-dependent dehydrogenase (short-subunit alcohol dehydrogenase family)